MKDEIIKELRREQSSSLPMSAHTIRIPEELSQEIRDFCGQTGIRIATVWRKCLTVGWEHLDK